MKRTFLLIAFVTLTSIAFAQKDSTAKKDTVYKDRPVPVYIIETTDTLKVPVLQYEGKKNFVMYSKPGYIIRKGSATPDGRGGLRYIKEPEVIGALDDKKRPVKPL